MGISFRALGGNEILASSVIPFFVSAAFCNISLHAMEEKSVVRGSWLVDIFTIGA